MWAIAFSELMRHARPRRAALPSSGHTCYRSLVLTFEDKRNVSRWKIVSACSLLLSCCKQSIFNLAVFFWACLSHYLPQSNSSQGQDVFYLDKKKDGKSSRTHSSDVNLRGCCCPVDHCDKIRHCLCNVSCHWNTKKKQSTGRDPRTNVRLSV